MKFKDIKYLFTTVVYLYDERHKAFLAYTSTQFSDDRRQYHYLDNETEYDGAPIINRRNLKIYNFDEVEVNYIDCHTKNILKGMHSMLAADQPYEVIKIHLNIPDIDQFETGDTTYICDVVKI